MCQPLTNLFDLDKEIKVIDCNAKKTGKKAYRRKVVLVSTSLSNWTNSWKKEVETNVNFRTEFNLFRSEKEYLLQVVGISDHKDFIKKNKVIRFSDPKECMDIILDESNHDLYMSDPVMTLLDGIFESIHISQWEKDRWEEVLIDSEE